MSTATFATPKGGQGSGALALPETEKAPALVVLHEWWGLTDEIREVTQRFAAAGYLSLAPDLYDGKVATRPNDASKLMQGLDWPKTLDLISGAARFAKSHPRSNGKVGIVGFSMGGGMAFSAICDSKEFAAAVSFYGLPPKEFANFANVRTPVLAHFAEHDAWAKPSVAAEIQSALQKLGQAMELHVYPAQQAFFFDTGHPEVHDPASAALAWDRTLSFLQKLLLT